MGRELAAVSGAFDAAERDFRIGHRHAVDEDLAGIELIDEPLLLCCLACPGIGAKSERRGVGNLYCFLDVGCAVYRGNRAEHLFAEYRHVFGDIGDDGRRVVPPGDIWAYAPAADGGTGRDGLLDLLVDLVTALLGGQRSDIGGRVRGVADA
ncbi:Uncharacterised protein [Mycobacteroides abscessus subsp. abscessus]|nr:Uncharacterised protein [Mycobacteroides abscessus subsp. abscessus]